MAEVSKVWSVNATKVYASNWNERSLDRLGGLGVCNRVWNSLKDDNLTGAAKRAATEMAIPAKKARLSGLCETDTGVAPAVPSCSNEHNNNVSSLDNAARTPAARRKAVSITDWLLNSPVPSPRAPPAKTTRKRRTRSAKGQTTLQNTPAIPPSPSCPALPCLDDALPGVEDFVLPTPPRHQKRKRTKSKKAANQRRPLPAPATPCPSKAVKEPHPLIPTVRPRLKKTLPEATQATEPAHVKASDATFNDDSSSFIAPSIAPSQPGQTADDATGNGFSESNLLQ